MEPKITTQEAVDFLGVSLPAIHKKLKTLNLSYKKIKNKVYFGHETARKLFNIPFKKKIIAIQIVKGGTGKTSITQSVAIRASLYGARVLCLDLDQQGNLTQSFSIQSENLPIMIDVLKDSMPIEDAIIPIIPGVDLLPSRIENAVLDSYLMLNRYPLNNVYKDKLVPLKEKYDLILIDCPPALGSSVTAAALSSDLVIAPLTPENFCFSGLKITHNELLNIMENFHVEIPFRLLLNKFDGRTSLSGEVLETLTKHPIYGELRYKRPIRISQDFPNIVTKGGSIFDNLKATTSKEDIDLLTREILQLQNTTGPSVSLGSLENSPELAMSA